MDRLSVLCFGGTYGLALACDLARFVVRGTARWYATLALTTLAWVVQTAYLGNLAIKSGQLPVTTVFESLLVVSWVLAAVGLYLIVRSPKQVAVGVFVLPVVVGLVVVAGVWAPRDDWAGSGWGGATSFWGSAHGLLYLVGAVASCVAFAAGLMYLAQSRRLKRKRPPRFGFALPSLEQSERLNRGAITVAFPFLTAGLLVGVVMEVALRKAGHSRLGWTDPKVVSGVLMWLVFAGLLHARFRPEMRGRRVMLFTIIAFVSLALATVGVDLMHITSHGVPEKPKAGEAREVARARCGLSTLGHVVREALAFEGSKLVEGLESLRAAFPGSEFVVLSTCNRVEVYAASSSDALPATGALIDFLAHFHATPAETFAADLFDHHDSGRSRTCSRSPPASKAWFWAKARSSARSATPTRRPTPARPSGRSSTRSSPTPSRSASSSASRPAWTVASSPSPASRSTSPRTSSIRSPTRRSWSSAPARWAT